MKNMHTSAASREFLLLAISDYIQNKTNGVAKWHNAVVLRNRELNMSLYQLTANLAPLLVQVFSHYWVYDDGKVHMTGNIYETLSIWFSLLNEKYGGKLHGICL
jgi:hypothetical protein